MNELTYYVATTLNGFIAHDDGSFNGFQWDDEVVTDFFADIKKFKTVLMGRKTYEVGLKQGKTNPYPAMRQIVFSRTMKSSPDDAVELVKTDVTGFVQTLRSGTDAPIWLCGGADLAWTLMQAKMIDHLVVKLNPVVFGSGIPLFKSDVGQIALKLNKTKKYRSGIVLLHYEVVQPDA